MLFDEQEEGDGDWMEVDWKLECVRRGVETSVKARG